jgi:hypothetical protein
MFRPATVVAACEMRKLLRAPIMPAAFRSRGACSAVGWDVSLISIAQISRPRSRTRSISWPSLVRK